MARYVFAVVVILAGCARGGVSPTAPGSSTTTPAQAVPPAGPGQCSTLPPITFPNTTRPARTYVGATTCPSASRFVLYDDGSFALQYVMTPGEYRGSYVEKDGATTFRWDAQGIAGPWGADGTITSETLSVHFNSLMQLDDFEDADYARVQ